jgi:hypothetical protein
MTNKKWEYMFRSAVKENYCRMKCLFIDQVYHASHTRLHEAIYANFSIMHKMIWVVNCMERGMKDQTMKSLSRAGNDIKKSMQYKKFIIMQLGEEYADETKVMNRV